MGHKAISEALHIIDSDTAVVVVIVVVVVVRKAGDDR